MNAKKLMAMMVVLLLLGGVALIQRQGAAKRHPAPAGETTLLQGVELNALDGLSVAAGSNTVALAKREGIWRVDSLYGYPADFSKLAEALRSAARVELGKPVRSAHVDASEFGFDDARSIVLESTGKEVARVEVGARREASDTAGWANQHFVRRNGGAEIYLVDYDFRPFSEEAVEWLDRKLLDVSPAEIVAVKAGGIELKVDGTEWTLAGLDRESEELQPSEASRIRSALQRLECTGVADPNLSDADLGFTNATLFTASTTNLTYVVEVGGPAEHGRYVHFSGDAPGKLFGWTYVVSDNDANDFLVSRDQLVKAKEPPAAPAEEDGAGTPAE